MLRETALEVAANFRLVVKGHGIATAFVSRVVFLRGCKAWPTMPIVLNWVAKGIRGRKAMRGLVGVR